MRLGPEFIAALVLLYGCSCEDESSSPQTPSASASASAAAAVVPPTPSKPTTLETADGVTLAGDLLLSAEPTAPVLVLIHSFRVDRSEWGPLVEKMAAAERRYTIVNVDLRGHGASRGGKDGGKTFDFSTIKPEDVEQLVQDVEAAAKHGVEATGGRASSVVLLGSSLGAALAAKAASTVPKVSAVGLVSPGAAIHGFDVYRPFADVRALPAFIGASGADNVSREPLAALTKMAKKGTVKTYEGQAHSARWIGKDQPALWDDLAAWLSQVYDAKPSEPMQPTPPTEPEKSKPKGPGGKK